MRIATVVGARPNFVKLAPLSMELRRRGLEEIVIHTGQHYDFEMSRIFFQQLDIPEPDVNLEVGSGSHARQTGEVMVKVEDFLGSISPDLVVVFGDVNSTLGAALAAVKIGLPVAHVEAGARSFDRSMPEEVNRVLVDHLARILLAPTLTASRNLLGEGINEDWVYLTGDIMVDAFLINRDKIEGSTVLERIKVDEGGYILVTIHRAENTGKPERLESIIDSLGRISGTKVFCLHPRTRKALESQGLDSIYRDDSFVVTKPMGYLDFLKLEMDSRMIITDSGGVQKEAYLAGKPCLTLRSTTEWPETVESGWNSLVDADPEKIIEGTRKKNSNPARNDVFGNGKASEKMVDAIVEFLSSQGN